MCRNKVKESIHKYHALTPVNDVDCDVYLDALQEALQNKDIKNIAVTGPYGSGKSSVIRTFFAKRNGEGKYKPITITLANFDTNVLSPKGEEETDPVRAKIYGEKLEQLIERSIVQQLFYHETDEALPESHFKKIRKEKCYKKVLGTLHVLLIILSAIILLFSEKFWDLPLLKDASEQCQYWTSVAAWIYTIFGGCTIIYIIRKLMLQVSAMKFRVENAEIELKTDNSLPLPVGEMINANLSFGSESSIGFRYVMPEGDYRSVSFKAKGIDESFFRGTRFVPRDFQSPETASPFGISNEPNYLTEFVWK